VNDLRRTVSLIGLASAAWVISVAWDPWSRPRLTDVPVYREYARLMFDGQIPYRDFSFEYPPGAAVPMALARLVPMDYLQGFSLLMYLALVATALGVAATGRRGAQPARARQVAARKMATTRREGGMVGGRYEPGPSAAVADATAHHGLTGRNRVAR